MKRQQVTEARRAGDRWILRLACGHEHAAPVKGVWYDKSEAAKPPRSVVCESCERDARKQVGLFQ